MKQFIIKIIACGLLLVIVDSGVCYTHGKIFGNLPDKTSMVSTIYQSLFKKSADILILGSSSANHHYNSMMLEDSLKLSVYNSGLDGRDMVYFDVVLQSTLDRQIPKYVVLDISPGHINGSWINRIGDTKLYYRKNNAVTKYYDNETGWQQKLKLKSSLYRYNKTLSYLIRVRLDRPNVLKGYAPLYGNKEGFEKYVTSDFSVNSVELKHLDSIVDICKSNNIKLILVQSPQENENSAFDNWIVSYTSEKGILLITENKNPYYYEHPELFYDGSHLNADGADLFTNQIIKRIKCIINYNNDERN